MSEKLEYVRIKNDPLPRLYRVLHREEDRLTLVVVEGPDLWALVYAYPEEVVDGREGKYADRR